MYNPLVLLNASVIVGSASDDISDHVTSVRITRRFELLDDTRMGLTARSRKPGLEDWRIEVNIIQEFMGTSSGAGIDKILASLSALTSAFPIKVKPVAAAQGPDNPLYTGNVFLEQYEPMNGEIGQIMRTTVPFVSAGNFSRLVSSS